MGHMRRRCTDEPTHPPTMCVHQQSTAHSRKKTSIINNPRTHHCVQQYNKQYSSTAEKNESKKAGTGVFELPHLGLAEKKRGKSTQGEGIGTHALSGILSLVHSS